MKKKLSKLKSGKKHDFLFQVSGIRHEIRFSAGNSLVAAYSGPRYTVSNSKTQERGL